MKRDARLREGLVNALLVAQDPEDRDYITVDPKLAGEILEEWDAMGAERDRLQALLVEHHAAGAMDGALIGEQCPVCKSLNE